MVKGNFEFHRREDEDLWQGKLNAYWDFKDTEYGFIKF